MNRFGLDGVGELGIVSNTTSTITRSDDGTRPFGPIVTFIALLAMRRDVVLSIDL